MPAVAVVPEKTNLEEAVWWRLMEENAEQVLYNDLCGLEHVNLVTNGQCSSVDGSSVASCGEYAHLKRQWQTAKLLIRTRKGQTKFTPQEKREGRRLDKRMNN